MASAPIVDCFWSGFQPAAEGKLPVRLDKTPKGVTVVTLAFAGPTTKSTLTTAYLCKYYNPKQIIAWSKTLQRRGIKVLMSIIDNPSAQWGQVDIAKFAKSAVKTIVGDWGLDGIDVDGESETATAEDFTNLIGALRKELGPVGGGKLLTFDSYLFSQDDQTILREVGDDLDWVNVMAYFLQTQAMIARFEQYAGLIGPGKVTIGVKPGTGEGDQSTPLPEVVELARYQPKGGRKGGMMLYALTRDVPAYTDHPQWSWTEAIIDNVSARAKPGAKLPAGLPRAALANSYMTTNRNAPGSSSVNTIVPLSGSYGAALWWYMSPNYYDTNVHNYEPQSSIPTNTAPSNFGNSLVTQLRQQSSPKLAVFIHGLGNTWSDAVEETATFGRYLQAQGYRGLMVGFSWPSYDLFDSGLYYSPSPYAFPPAADKGSIRGNINGSRESFGNLMSFLENLMALVPGLRISILCHSEGNYMMMLGMYKLTCVKVDQIILFAADINNAALQTPASGLTGQGSYIAPNANRITVYYSANDDTLADSEAAYQPLGYHNPIYGGRLGQTGPSYNYGSQQPNCTGVDCSLVVNEQNVNELIQKGIVPPLTDLHSSYRYIPQVLQDMVATMNGTPSGSIANRTKLCNASSYTMRLVTARSRKAATKKRPTARSRAKVAVHA